jgi:HD-like signal output (HDOD) protein
MNVDRNTMAYVERRNLGPIAQFLPREPGLKAHVFRVAALAVRAAGRSGFTETDLESVEWAALLHHHAIARGDARGDAPADHLAEASFSAKLLSDLGLPVPPEPASLPVRVTDVLRVYRGTARSADPFVAPAAVLVESANLFDEQIENLPYENAGAEEAIRQLLATGIVDRAFSDAVQSFRVVGRQGLIECAKRLPVFPKAAMQALRMVRDPQSGLREIERVISGDSVLAGEMVHLANSGMFGTGHPATSLAVALTRVGTEAAGKLIAAAAVRRSFISGNLHQLWLHSAETADQAASVSVSAGGLDSGEAYLAGLVHDVGRLAFEISPAAASLHQWEESGFPPVYAEFLVSGTDHAAIGAEILKMWCFPEGLVEAVKYHHRPEATASRMASVLYAAEDPAESLPSCARDHSASKRLDIEEIPRARSAS